MSNVHFFSLQSKMMLDALHKRSQNCYEIAMDSFVHSYFALDLALRYPFKNLLIDAYYNYSKLFLLLNDIEACLIYLKRAINLGFTDFTKIDHDVDFQILNKNEAYLSLVESSRKAKNYLMLLKSVEYDYTVNETLVIIDEREKYKHLFSLLESEYNVGKIAGEGTALERILRLMYWIHGAIKHDGENGDSSHRDIFTTLKRCITEKIGLNCRGLSGVFNAVMLAMNFHSRIVICKPENSLGIDQDCHVINNVYIDEMQKWVWVDVTLCAYIMDEEGTLLSIDEVRTCLIHDLPLVLNPDANWNNRHVLNAGEYVYKYMAKNLYYFVCPVLMQNPEKHDGQIDLPINLYLIPKSGESVSLIVSREGLTGRGLEQVRIIHSPSLFWQSPVLNC